MTQGKINEMFLEVLDTKTCNAVIENIAAHYGISVNDAIDEVIDDEAESIMDYLTGSVRTATSLFYNQFKLKLSI